LKGCPRQKRSAFRSDRPKQPPTLAVPRYLRSSTVSRPPWFSLYRPGHRSGTGDHG
jgi:hypothetical protein